MIGASAEIVGSAIRTPRAVFVQRRFNRKKNLKRLKFRKRKLDVVDGRKGKTKAFSGRLDLQRCRHRCT